MRGADPAAALRRSRSEPHAFGEFYECCFEPVLAFLARRVLDPEVAVDLAAETFAQAYVARNRFRGTETPQAEAWIFRIARRQLGAYFRRGCTEDKALRKLGIEVPALDPEEFTRIEELAEIDGLRGAVRTELSQLSDAQRSALELRVVSELTYEQVAARLEITEQAARLRVSRGLRALANALDANPTMKEMRT